MDKLKTFRVTIERREVAIETAIIEIQAENEADARTLARYHRIESWEWGPKERQKHAQVVVGLTWDPIGQPQPQEPTPPAPVAPVDIGADNGMPF